MSVWFNDELFYLWFRLYINECRVFYSFKYNSETPQEHMDEMVYADLHRVEEN